MFAPFTKVYRMSEKSLPAFKENRPPLLHGIKKEKVYQPVHDAVQQTAPWEVFNSTIRVVNQESVLLNVKDSGTIKLNVLFEKHFDNK